MSDAFKAAGNGNHSGLALAIALQLKALELYHHGFYADAIYYALLARDFAFQIIEANGAEFDPDLNKNHLERNYQDEGPGGDELEKDLDLSSLGGDDQVLQMTFNFDV